LDKTDNTMDRFMRNWSAYWISIRGTTRKICMAISMQK